MALYDCVKGVKVSEIVCALPSQHFAPIEYAPDLLDEKHARLMARDIGISQLRIAPDDMTASDLFAFAAEKILEHRNRSDIAAVVFVTQTADYRFPATSHILQDRLGLGNNVLCLDINEGCSGFMTGLYVASTLARNLKAGVLLGVGDTLSKVTSPKDRASRCIFGDEVAVTLVEPGEHNIPFAFTSYGDKSGFIMMDNSGHRKTATPRNDGYFYMNGLEVLNFSFNEAPEVIKDFKKHNKIDDKDITFYAFHQANKLIVENLADKMGVPNEKLPFVAGDTGNISAASIPSVIVRTGGGAQLTNVLCCGFGVGMAVGVCLADFSQTKLSEVYL